MIDRRHVASPAARVAAHGYRGLVTIAALSLLAVGVAVAVPSETIEHERSSDTYLEAAADPCRDFRRTVADVRVGAGTEDLVRQLRGFRRARAHLRQQLRRLAISERDATLVRPLLRNLANGNRFLTKALSQVVDDPPGVSRSLEHANRLLDRQLQLTRKLGLGSCGR